eukprot:gb/GECG01015216.1/.p1 GENE.gb/GECG01015216.1/~~gb/GECG01015216.1/.p1  ORF type:complete len:135 (+),score=26.37 gb/GECG01015216.1/:1-405(+)
MSAQHEDSTKLDIQDMSHTEEREEEKDHDDSAVDQKEQTEETGQSWSNHAFTFHLLSQSVQDALPSLKEREMRQNLMRWNLEPFLSASRLSYEEKLDESKKGIGNFLCDLFNCEALRESLPVCMPSQLCSPASS